jgi:membrane fusion protein, multidrug efflux system
VKDSVNKKPLSKHIWILISVFAACFLLASCGSSSGTAEKAGDGGGKGKGKGKGGGGGAVPVVAAMVSKKDVPVEVQVVGSVEAYSTISVKAQVPGQLTNVFFQEGDYVKKDAKLFTIDPRPYQAQLSQAEANIQRSRALLAQAQANLSRDTAQQQYAQGLADRTQKLVQEGIVAKEQGDQLRSNADSLVQTVVADRAAIDSARAQVAADDANIANLRIQLGYTNITSPIDGRTGNLTVKAGNIVAANTLEMMTINQIEPIYVTFAVPEARLSEVKKYMNGGKLPVIVTPQDGSGTTEQGVLTFIDNSVDTSTGTIKLKGTFVNTDRGLWPGQFVNVTLRLTTQPGAITVPNAAVQNGQDGQFVYVVGQDRAVEARPVVTGARVGEDMVITKGLDAGETVVTEGQLRLQPGSRVQMRDSRAGGAQPGGGEGFKGGDKGGDAAKGGEGFKEGFKRGDGSKRGDKGKGGEGFKKRDSFKGAVRGDGPGGGPTAAN